MCVGEDELGFGRAGSAGRSGRAGEQGLACFQLRGTTPGGPAEGGLVSQGNKQGRQGREPYFNNNNKKTKPAQAARGRRFPFPPGPAGGAVEAREALRGGWRPRGAAGPVLSCRERHGKMPGQPAGSTGPNDRNGAARHVPLLGAQRAELAVGAVSTGSRDYLADFWGSKGRKKNLRGCKCR